MTRELARTEPPSRWLRFWLRVPIWLFRARLGFLFGKRFLLLTHVGRKSGAKRYTALEVVHREPAAGVYVIASGWGERAQWFRNVMATPRVEVMVGVRRFAADARRLPVDEAHAILTDYTRRHPKAFRTLSKFMVGEPLEPNADGARALAEVVPLVSVTPAG